MRRGFLVDQGKSTNDGAKSCPANGSGAAKKGDSPSWKTTASGQSRNTSAKKTAQRELEVYQLKITLCDSYPPVWRRIQVPSNYSFLQLHRAISDAMGWKDYHLHAFTLRHDPNNAQADEIRLESADPEVPGPDREARAMIADYFPAPNRTAMYEYDFGDGWEHEVLFERTLPMKKDREYPNCMAGARACPPEDCGGWYGYEGMLCKLANPQHPERAGIIEWLEQCDYEEYDPDQFFPDEVEFRD